MTIKNIFEKRFDEEVHSAFLKFGKGEYKDRYLIEAKKQKDAFAIKTSAEFANLFVKRCLEKAGRVEVKGIIVSTFDLAGELKFPIKKKSNFQGVRKIDIETEVDSKEILELMKKYPRVFFALSFKIPNCELKIKAKAPKNAKPGKGDEDAKADFCSLKTSDRGLVKELLFDIDDFKEVKIKHTINVKDILYPKDFSSMKPEEVREKSKRKGVVIREIAIDGRSLKREADFEA